ncbi:hypothetical protein [Candidatus Enterovibrio escicola]|nr:hypothetical protein [Candidatus Enterovibrio escacola]
MGWLLAVFQRPERMKAFIYKHLNPHMSPDMISDEQSLKHDEVLSESMIYWHIWGMTGVMEGRSTRAPFDHGNPI